MTTRTLYTTWVRLTGETLEAWAPDERAVGYLTSEVERLLEPYEAGLLSREEVMLLIQEQYALMRVPSYFRKSIPNSWGTIKALVKQGDIRLSEVLEKNESLDKYLTIQPNYSWTDLSYNKGGVNPEFSSPAISGTGNTKRNRLGVWHPVARLLRRGERGAYEGAGQSRIVLRREAAPASQGIWTWQGLQRHYQHGQDNC